MTFSTIFGLASPLDAGAILEEESSVSTGNSISEGLTQLEKGNSPGVRVVNSQSQLQAQFENDIRGGTLVERNGGRIRYELPDGTTVQYRTYSSSGGDTIDIQYPNGTSATIHIK